MYNVELSDAALNDLRSFTYTNIQEIFRQLQNFQNNPKPRGVQTVLIPEAADGVAYFCETALYRIVYNIFEEFHLIKVVAIFKKINLN
ncbi:hypothetical protein QUF58_04025 [Anaerolineales bacterium HSG24]|nr:hypothetical protein [Anaerolineales bacterium HSG24]